ncbi:MAG: short-chain dehydrogenase [Microbacterium sp.]|jgi:short-subunit dehydrogenase|uniref:KR domain-containing protein n=1 Tax=Microbacterium ginsengisoli TaxID=400772 RepID=A0A3C1KIB5_9MICO|nr:MULTISPECIES: SDR family NAD(P)-dependent oxidoreductase [unclassified Microbacterium]MAL05937.1 short-chain dehydrogenase [Microbacterium sp.]MBN9198952.1 SDR family NAD(P)-dependent oxidoreductase [Microbacterium ginsengisoli]MCK9917525.1 SDR family NAD(P)-dependent oxidoreductase [Microbacteriaceae bacterium K1510]KQR92289.1 short-chain dehydrogenase [Microbacterium sp. Leaf351]KQR92812.1 short-chain dehydrogenase [Microbacterium sp. Leaf347]
MARTALITGASAGLGAEYARQLAQRGASLVLVARSHDALEQLASQLRGSYGVEVETLAVDLLKRRERAKVEARLRDRARPIELLINNAGFGLPLAFERNDVELEVSHLKLHVEVPLRLTHAALGAMLERGRGRIVNVASVAGFLPRSTYGACKGWLISFSRWANVQYTPRGVTVTAVCPGFTHTSFHERMGLAPGNEGVPSGLWLDASLVVSESLRDVARGKSVSIPSLRYKILVRLTALLPDAIAARIGQRGR